MSPEPFKILVVDDSVSIADSLAQILKVSGYDVEPVYSANEAIRKMSVSDYDLIISDIDMPGISGLDFLAKIRAEYGNKVAVILTTGFLDQEYFIKAIRLGATDFLRKPIDSHQIIRTIQTLISKQKEHDDMGMFFSHLDRSEICFVIDPQYLASFSISNIFTFILRHHFNIATAMANELLICIDEMIYNAYIHGTLQLSKHERFLDTKSFREMVETKLKDPIIASRRIHFKIIVEPCNGVLTLEVEDEGEGFAHETWLHRVKTDQTLNIEEYGRGISLLYHLSDELEFANGGRKISIKKHLSPTDKTELAAN